MGLAGPAPARAVRVPRAALRPHRARPWPGQAAGPSLVEDEACQLTGCGSGGRAANLVCGMVRPVRGSGGRKLSRREDDWPKPARGARLRNGLEARLSRADLFVRGSVCCLLTVRANVRLVRLLLYLGRQGICWFGCLGQRRRRKTPRGEEVMQCLRFPAWET